MQQKRTRGKNKNVTKGDAQEVIRILTRKFRDEYGLGSHEIADHTTKIVLKPGAPQNSVNPRMFDVDKVHEAIKAHHNMKEFNGDRRDLETNVEIFENYLLEGNQSKMIREEGVPLIVYDTETRMVNFNGERKEYTPFTLLQKIEHSTPTSDRVIKSFQTIDSRGPNGENGVAAAANLSAEVKEAWKDYNNNKITKKEFVDIVRMEDEEENDPFAPIREGSEAAVRVSQEEGPGRRKKR